MGSQMVLDEMILHVSKITIKKHQPSLLLLNGTTVGYPFYHWFMISIMSIAIQSKNIILDFVRSQPLTFGIYFWYSLFGDCLIVILFEMFSNSYTLSYMTLQYWNRNDVCYSPSSIIHSNQLFQGIRTITLHNSNLIC